jgi:hypothetical protein
MRSRVQAVLLVSCLMTVACFASKPVSTVPTPGATVRIVFKSAIDVTTVRPGVSDSRQSHGDVLEASGRVQAAAGDTIALRLGELRTASGAVSGVAGRVALLPTASVARIEERQFQAGRTALTGFAVATVALATFLVVVIAAMMKGF